jgi:hypothetical protein
MVNKKILGVVLIVVGLGLAFWGYQLSQSVESALTEVVTGAETDQVMLLYIGAAVCLVTGLFLNFKR